MPSEQEGIKEVLLEQLALAYDLVFFIYHPAENTFVYLNPAFEPVWGVAPKQFLGHPEGLLETVYSQDKNYVQDNYQQLLQDKSQKKVKFRIKHPEKGIRWICLTAKFSRLKEREYLVGYAEDYTEDREYKYNLIKFNTKKNSTLEILSHDLASPFANIQGLANLLISQGNLNEKALGLLSLIRQDAQRGTNLIQDFVNNEFLESSQVVLNKDRVDLVHRLQVLIDNYRSGQDLIEKNFGLEANKKSVYVSIDEMKFMQVLNNLISNAIKFTHDNGQITLSVEDRKERVRISVADDGVGIPEELQPVLFDKFTKARRPGLRGEKSIGLGMSIIRTIVELHKGSIWFESAEGKGSVFYIEIPKE